VVGATLPANRFSETQEVNGAQLVIPQINSNRLSVASAFSWMYFGGSSDKFLLDSTRITALAE
jgi:hypothetical protein